MSDIKTIEDIEKMKTQYGSWYFDLEQLSILNKIFIRWIKEDIEDFGIDINGEPTIENQLINRWMKRLNVAGKDLK